MGVFMSCFGVVLLLLLGLIHEWHAAIFTTIAFFGGVITSVVCGFIGMRVGQSQAKAIACILRRFCLVRR
jgi:Na+/H+-translocating membrane pyrophosphatase